jgi:hypothetical protein
VVVTAIACTCGESILAGLFGPPEVTLREAYEPGDGGPDFDHSVLDTLLKEHVDPAGWVDYAGLADDPASLDTYLDSLATAPFAALGRDAKLALLLNAYNAFTLRLILDHYPLDSIRDIPPRERWEGRTWNVGGHRWTLEQIEHEQCRANFREPRIHFALNCASIGCPPLRPEAYTAARLEDQLADQTAGVHRDPRWARFDPDSGVLELTRLYLWYAGDFEQVAGSVLDFVAPLIPALRRYRDAHGDPEVRWLDWDWNLNDARNR